jgi:HlyD family secretion protein
MNSTIKLGVTAGIALLIAAAMAYIFKVPNGDVSRYRFISVVRGPITNTVTATGTLHAVVTVDVGTQVSGLIKTLHADFNSEVSAGEIIARIDAAPFEAVLRQAEAEHAIARANVAIQEASLTALEAELAGHHSAETEARDELERQRSLLSTRNVPTSAVATALASHRQS